ncbi:anti-repressor SinI family protein [Sediminibacillus halophilus]|uniref:Anti-repressor SinI n=1 Tax=Sediminibacillus halophilus TaxID=482461 RepID=A0A1G9VGN4_9BACI|nr:anti-repressor SinI family protein [Sediminibacillus halophilus]SDM71221.1 Anti-repressor SinI [Sediminibacillus halophilus]
MERLREKPYIDTEWLELIQEALELGMTSQDIRDFLKQKQYMNQYNSPTSANCSLFEDEEKR